MKCKGLFGKLARLTVSLSFDRHQERYGLVLPAIWIISCRLSTRVSGPSDEQYQVLYIGLIAIMFGAACDLGLGCDDWPAYASSHHCLGPSSSWLRHTDCSKEVGQLNVYMDETIFGL